MPDTRQSSVTRAVLSAVAINAADAPPLPASLSGTLGSGSSASTASDDGASLVCASIVARGKQGWRGVRTSPALIDALSGELHAARTLGEVRSGLAALRQRLLTTGVYRDVAVSLQPGADGGGVDVALELDELSYSVSQGFATDAAGTGGMSASTDATLLNPFGMGERWTASVKGSSAEGVFASSSIAPLSSARHSAGDAPPLPPATSGGFTLGAISPAVQLGFRKPTLFGWRTPLAVSFRTETERSDATLGFAKKVVELETALTDVSGQHSLAHVYALRSVLPLPHATSPFLTASSPLVVANCDTSAKSSLIYSYSASSLRGAPLASSGSRLAASAELAGLGGDERFLRLEASLAHVFSLARYAPDTGYCLPAPRGSSAAAAAAAAAAASSSAAAAEEGGLRPHPGAALFSWLDGSAGGRAAPPPSAAAAALRRQLAGWLAPGVTVSLEASAGALHSWGGGGAADVPRAFDGPHLADRFFLTAARLRGYEAVGPAAPPLRGGARHGDAQGGDAYALLTARLLLPPPLPSVRAANAGLRTHVFATAGRVGSLRQVAATPGEFLSGFSAAAGVGLTMPLVGRLAAEANWALWHGAQAGDATASFAIALSG